MLNKKIGLVAMLACFAASGIMAGTLTNYTSGDVLLCFTKGGQDLVVDIGPVTALTGASANQRIPITQYNATQLGDLGNNNTLTWSAYTWLANDTLFVTRPRTSLTSQTAPWVSTPVGNQQLVDGRMKTVPLGSASFSLNSPNVDNSSTAIIETSDTPGLPNPGYTSGTSYYSAMRGSYGGNFNGFFQGNPEKTTAGNFTTVGQVVRSDFYMMTPNTSSTAGTWLGYFEFAPNGTMTYVAYPSSTPVIKSISRTNTTATISYIAGVYGTYKLRGTYNLTTAGAVTNWPAITTVISGDNNIHTVTDTDAAAVKFYTITAQ